MILLIQFICNTYIYILYIYVTGNDRFTYILYNIVILNVVSIMFNMNISFVLNKGKILIRLYKITI